MDTQTIDAPQRSLQQRMDALAHANEIRSRRAVLKKQIATRQASLPGLILDPPDWLHTAKARELMLAMPSFGPTKVGRLLNHCRMSPSKTIGGMTRRQRVELVELIGGAAAA